MREPRQHAHTGAMITEQIQFTAPGESADAYNYLSYSYASEAVEFERWLTEGPHVGDPAPDFKLADLDGNSVS